MPNHSILNAHGPSDYYPFGLMMSGRSWSEGYRFGFNGQEQDDEVYGEGILNTALYWEYDTRLGRRWNIDIVSSSSESLYSCFLNNPVFLVDLLGASPSTIVEEQEDGTYEVVGGNPYDGDNGIYTLNEDGTKNLIGHSATPFSFYNDDQEMEDGKGSGIMVGFIDPKDQSGREFLFTLYEQDPAASVYVVLARRNGVYDYKRTNGSDKVLYSNNDNNVYYRGMEILISKSDGLPVYASARDVGNIGAGMVAARNGLTWQTSRVGFDLYQSYDSFKQKEKATWEFVSEGVTTQYAQKLGYNVGYQYYLKEVISRTPGMTDLKSIRVHKNFIKLGEL